jgi:hypothetical protein
MTDSDSSMMNIAADEDSARLYIDENVCDPQPHRQQTRATNTGNPFELDFFLLASLNRFRTRSSQTVLTSDTSLLRKRHRATICQAQCFAVRTQDTSTSDDEEERVVVIKKSKTRDDRSLLSL